MEEGVKKGYFFCQVGSLVDCCVYGGEKNGIIELDAFEDGIQS